MVKFVVRSTSVPIAVWLPFPMIRSPSQCPGTARSSASAGRSEMLIIPGIRFFRCPGARLGRRTARPVRRLRVSSRRSAPLACRYSDR